MEKVSSDKVNKTQEVGLSQYRQYARPMTLVVQVLSVGIALFLLLYSMGFLSTPIIFITVPQFCALGSGLILALLFLLVPASKNASRKKLPWYDLLFILMSLSPTVYFFLVYPSRIFLPRLQGFHELVLGVFLIVATFEAARRTSGLVFMILVACFMAYPFVSRFIPGAFHYRGISISSYVERMFFFESGIFGMFLEITLGVIFVFVLFGAFLEDTGAGEFLVKIANSIVGRLRGGSAWVVVIATGLIGMVVGSPVASAAALGKTLVPRMKEQDYKPEFAAAVLAVGATGSQLMPPIMGAVVFLMMVITGFSYWDIAVAAISPAILYYSALGAMIHFEALKLDRKPLPRALIPSFLKTIVTGGSFLIPITVLVLLLGYVRLPPQRACLYGLGSLILVSCISKKSRIKLSGVLRALDTTSKTMTTILPMIGALVFVAFGVDTTGLAITLGDKLLTLAGNNLLVILIFTAFLSYILGMGTPTPTAYLVPALMMAPALIKMGLSPLVAHMFILYWALVSHITPPVCPTAYVCAAIAGAPMVKTGLLSMYLGSTLLLIPFIFAYEPALLLQGSLAQILFSFATTFFGVVLLASVGMKYLRTSLTILEQVLIGTAAIMLIWPANKVSAIGAIIGSVTVLWHYNKHKIIRK
jgi:TRAP transporter 4TM/12TM fusion protein